jgi:hypothetical protein
VAGETRRFEEVSSQVGIGPYIAPFGMAGGTAAADYDNDGDIDLFVPNGEGIPDQLYENQGDGSFLEIAGDAGVASTKYHRAGLWFDADNDNLLDLLVVGDCFCMPVPLCDASCINGITATYYRQTSPGHFTEATAAAGFDVNALLSVVTHVGGLSAGDINNDGYLDVFIGLWEGPVQLFLNQTDGTFVDIATEAGLIVGGTANWQPMMYDFDKDGFLDIYATIDFTDNQFWFNQQDSSFLDRALELGVNNCADNFCMNDMGLTMSDFDNDGDMDFYITNIYKLNVDQPVAYNVLYRNDSVGSSLAFAEIAGAYGVDNGGWGWGCTFMDLDNDGWQDLAATNGFEPIAAPRDNSRFFKNNCGDPNGFSDVSTEVGFNDDQWGSALLSFDYNRDGHLDLLQVSYGHVNQGIDPNEIFVRLLKNVPVDPNAATNNYLVIKPRMCGVNRRAIGATVQVTAGDLTMMRLISAGTSLLGQEPAEAFFGLGQNSMVQEVVVHWPAGGGSTTLNGVAANQVLTISKPLAEDFFADYKVDIKDFAVMSQQWQQTGPSLPADLNGDQVVNQEDLTLFCFQWLHACSN